jgi:hypothetical protein
LGIFNFLEKSLSTINLQTIQFFFWDFKGEKRALSWQVLCCTGRIILTMGFGWLKWSTNGIIGLQTYVFKRDGNQYFFS